MQDSALGGWRESFWLKTIKNPTKNLLYLAEFTNHIMRRVIRIRRYVDGYLSNQKLITLLIFNLLKGENMEELLKAMQKGDLDLVESLANKLLLTKEGRLNKAQVHEFERFAPCHIERSNTAYLGCCIRYYDKMYYFG